MKAYYNEIDPYAAQWLRNLIKAGRIAPGHVDERSIEDVHPTDLHGYTQCHFFAGIGVWSHALRAAGWADDRPAWTGSCPCQPFSAAGKGTRFDDQRHLWPAFEHLIRECRPAIVFGEQVASKDSGPWVDLVHDDLEALGYAFGAIPFPSAGIGAPHIRDRLYWVADSGGERREWWQGAAHRRIAYRDDARRIKGHDGVACAGEAGLRLADLHGDGCETRGEVRPVCEKSDAEHGGTAGGLADADGNGSLDGVNGANGRTAKTVAKHGGGDSGAAAGPTNGFWRDADWLGCRDGKFRPVEPGTQPLVDGVAAQVVRGSADWHAPAGKEGFGHRASRLKGYGNAINAEAARCFIESVMAGVEGGQ